MKEYPCLSTLPESMYTLAYESREEVMLQKILCQNDGISYNMVGFTDKRRQSIRNEAQGCFEPVMNVMKS